MTESVFFVAALSLTAAEAASLTGSALKDTSHAFRRISTLAALGRGGQEAVVFADSRKRPADLAGLDAAAILCPAELADAVPAGIAVLVSKRPQQAFAQIGRALFPDAAVPTAPTGEVGLAADAHISASARLEPGVIVESGTVIGPDVSIGSGTVICANSVIGRGCQIGRDGFIGPNVTIQFALIGNRVIIHTGARIGQDGFGYVAGSAGPEKIPQLGRVIIQDAVEIGANSTIDRGALDDTIIGEASKIDNLVQIGHNCRIGRGCLIAGHCGISGSVVLGDFVMLGGGVGISDHVTIGANAQIAGRSGVMRDVPEGARWAGHPAQSLKAYFREIATLRAMTKSKGKGGLANG